MSTQTLPLKVREYVDGTDLETVMKNPSLCPRYNQSYAFRWFVCRHSWIVYRSIWIILIVLDRFLFVFRSFMDSF